MPENVNISRMSRAASIAPASINEESRTVELVFTTGAMVRRFDWIEGEYEEELEVSEQAVNLERMNGGAPLLADHDCYDLDKVHGVVERAWIVNGEGRCLVRFAKDEDSERIWQKVKDGIIRACSVGYVVDTFMEIIENGRRILRAKLWTPLEVSLVAIGADPKAGVRSQVSTRPCVLQRAATSNGGQTMPTENENGGVTEQAPAPATETTTEAPAAPAPEAAPADAPATTDTRAEEIMEICQIGGVSLARALEFVKGGKTVAEVRSVLVNERASRSTDEIATQQTPAAPKEAGSTAKRMASKFKKS